MLGAKQSLAIALVGLFVILLSGWRPFATDLVAELTSVPQGFPEVQHPEDNAFTLDRWNLGRKLFFDPVMSRDSSISCASCHHPGVAFSDTVAFSPGVANAPGTRNAPTLTNVAYHPYLTRDGGVPTLEMQVLVPIQEHNEFDFNMNNELGRMVLNPDVVVRSRGVMEKCSFCLQMTQLAILEAKKEGRPVKDGEFKTACSAACSTGAMVFGDVNDESSEVAKLSEDDRTFKLLDFVGTKPNVFYQLKVKNTTEA